jgi:hypothetical protein
MKLISACLTLLLLSASGLAQSSSGSIAKPASRALLEGIVTKEPGGEPVKKALIELIAENQAEGGDYTAVSGADGMFHMEGIIPGRYRLFTERTGFLEGDKHHTRTDGRVLTLAAGQEVKDVRIRLQAAALVRGRVTDEDGEVMPNAQVAVLRQTFVSGRTHFAQVGAERTNDLGEYRVAGLPSGSYYVCVSPPPDFKSLIEAAGAVATVESGNRVDKPTATSYQVIYYPGTPDRNAAASIELHPGDDFPVNFSLTPSASLSIRGAVVNLPARASAAIMLQSRDFNLVLNGAEMHQDGTFVIRDVAPGAYTILATVENSSVPMMARQSVQMVSNSIDGLRLAPQPGAWIHGRLRFESKGNGARFDPSRIFLALRPDDGEDSPSFSFGEGFSQLAQVGLDGTFEWKGVPPGNYYLQISGETDLFLKSVLAGGRDVDESGISVTGGSMLLDVVGSASGGIIEGVATDRQGSPVSNAVVVAVPEARLRARVDRYYKIVSDQSGRFTLHGVRPGDFTLFAWDSVESEAYYSPEFLKIYEAQGSPLRVSEGDRKTVQLDVIPAGEDQP